MKIAHNIPVLLLAGFFVSLIAPLLTTMTTYAAVSCSWQGTTTINCPNPLGAFIQTNVSGNNMTLELQAYHSQQTTCNLQLQVNNYNTAKSGTITVLSALGCPSGYTIKGGKSTITITNPPGGGNPNPPPPPPPGITCTWEYQGLLKCGNIYFDVSATNNNQVTLTENPVAVGEICAAQIVINNYQTATNGVEHSANGLACVRNTLTNVNITNTWNSAPKPPGNKGNGNTPNIQMVCSVSILNPVTWLICPLVSAAQGAIEALTDGIDSLLTVNTNEIFGNTTQKGSTGAGFYQAWNEFRIFAVGLIVIAGLVMLIAQAAGTQAIDAYTIHKVLPRILIAIIFITLSWPLLNFAITLTNDIGTGIRAIIYTPFESIGTVVKVNGGAATVGAIVGTATFLTLGLLGIASFMLTALLAVFIGFLVLFLRQVIIMSLVIFAPLAIACYVLPGTQKVWNFWKDTFISMLIVFPIISAMIALGRVFAVVMYNNRTAGVPTFVNEIGAFIVYFLPYFLLPAAFRFAGGAMATIGGFMNDRSRGAFDRLKNLRKNQAQKNMQAMKSGSRFKSDNLLATGFNKTSRGIANLPSAGFNPRKMKSRFQAGSSLADEHELKEYMESEAFTTFSGNDDYLQATMRNMGGGDSEADWRRYLERNGYTGQSLEQGVAAIRQARRGTSREVFKKAAVEANASTGTGWKEGSTAQMLESINEAYGNDRHGATNALARMRGAASQSGRLDLAGMSFGQEAGEMNRMQEEAARNGGAVSEATKSGVNMRLAESTLATKGANDWARARGQAVEHLSVQMREDMQRQHAQVNQLRRSAPGSAELAKQERILAQKYANVANFHNSLNHMSPENAQYIADNVMSQRLDGDFSPDGSFHVREGAMTGNETMDAYVRDANSAAPSASARAYRDTRHDFTIRD